MQTVALTVSQTTRRTPVWMRAMYGAVRNSSSE